MRTISLFVRKYAKYLSRKIPLNERGCSSRQKSELKHEIDATFLEKRFPNGLEMSFDARCDI